MPYPFAADDHQAHNADALQGAGAAIALRQEQATEDALFQALFSLCSDAAKRSTMANAARARGVPDAADAIARDLLELAKLEARSEVA